MERDLFLPNSRSGLEVASEFPEIRAHGGDFVDTSVWVGILVTTDFHLGHVSLWVAHRPYLEEFFC